MVSVMAGDDAPKFAVHSAVPLYEQAADYVASQIQAGALQPGDQLPSLDDLAAEWAVGRETVQRAMRELKKRGLVVARVGKGTFIAAGG